MLENWEQLYDAHVLISVLVFVITIVIVWKQRAQIALFTADFAPVFEEANLRPLLQPVSMLPSENPFLYRTEAVRVDEANKHPGVIPGTQLPVSLHLEGVTLVHLGIKFTFLGHRSFVLEGCWLVDSSRLVGHLQTVGHSLPLPHKSRDERTTTFLPPDDLAVAVLGKPAMALFGLVVMLTEDYLDHLASDVDIVCMVAWFNFDCDWNVAGQLMQVYKRDVFSSRWITLWHLAGLPRLRHSASFYRNRRLWAQPTNSLFSAGYRNIEESPPQHEAAGGSPEQQNDDDHASPESPNGPAVPQLCAVCMTFPVSRVLLPCRHSMLCGLCMPRIDNCPACRSPVTSFFLIGDEPYLQRTRIDQGPSTVDVTEIIQRRGWWAFLKDLFNAS